MTKILIKENFFLLIIESEIFLVSFDGDIYLFTRQGVAEKFTNPKEALASLLHEVNFLTFLETQDQSEWYYLEADSDHEFGGF